MHTCLYLLHLTSATSCGGMNLKVTFIDVFLPVVGFSELLKNLYQLILITAYLSLLIIYLTYVNNNKDLLNSRCILARVCCLMLPHSEGEYQSHPEVIHKPHITFIGGQE